MNIAHFAFIALFGCLTAASPNGRKIENINNRYRIPGEFLVILHAPVEKETNIQYARSVSDKIAAITPKIVIKEAYTNLRHPILYVKTSDEGVMTQLFQLDEVNIIESNLHQPMIMQCNVENTGSQYWGLSRISSREPLNYASANSFFNPNAGSGVRIYVLDSGVRLTHMAFKGRAVFGRNFVDGTDDNDNFGHGTHCAGTAAGDSTGVSRAATVVAVKVVNGTGFGISSDAIAGIDWVISDIRSKGVRGVINFSSGLSTNLGLDSAANDADYAGIPFVAAAGNDNVDACNISPARASGVITVGATDEADQLAYFSNHGTCVNILAPGTNILSASYVDDGFVQISSGTSMACPHVAGLVANYLSVFPEATTAMVKFYVTNFATHGAIDLRGMNTTPNRLVFYTCS